jgi:hypothetical protein
VLFSPVVLRALCTVSIEQPSPPGVFYVCQSRRGLQLRRKSYAYRLPPNTRPFRSPSTPDATEEQLIGLWLQGKSANTVRAYRRDIAAFRTFIGKPIRLAYLGDLQRYADALAGSPASCARRLLVVKSLLSFASRMGFTPFNIGAAIRPPRPDDRLAERILDESRGCCSTASGIFGPRGCPVRKASCAAVASANSTSMRSARRKVRGLGRLHLWGGCREWNNTGAERCRPPLLRVRFRSSGSRANASRWDAHWGRTLLQPPVCSTLLIAVVPRQKSLNLTSYAIKLRRFQVVGIAQQLRYPVVAMDKQFNAAVSKVLRLHASSV